VSICPWVISSNSFLTAITTCQRSGVSALKYSPPSNSVLILLLDILLLSELTLSCRESFVGPTIDCIADLEKRPSELEDVLLGCGGFSFNVEERILSLSIGTSARIADAGPCRRLNFGARAAGGPLVSLYILRWEMLS
jgi:hypothetical protein